MNTADEISQAERRRIMADERRMKTYHGHALDGEPELGGRFKKVNTTTVVGTDPTVAVPTQLPWHSDVCPPEPPLGIDINAQEPTGEKFEQASVTGTVTEGSGPNTDHDKGSRGRSATKSFVRRA
jgi:hypothetical protein